MKGTRVVLLSVEVIGGMLGLGELHANSSHTNTRSTYTWRVRDRADMLHPYPLLRARPHDEAVTDVETK